MPWQTARHNLDYFFLMFDRSEVNGPMQVRDDRNLLYICYLYILSKCRGFNDVIQNVIIDIY